jgi:trehalose synthase
VLAAILDRADSEGWRAAKEISDYAQGTDGILLLTTYEGLGSLEVGALLLLARAVIERSLREGFDLSPFEALWKRTPVVGGLPLTIRDGVDGFLSPDTEQAAAHIVELVRDPGLAAEMGRAGRERVREQFLVTAALERELRALAASLRAAAPPE